MHSFLVCGKTLKMPRLGVPQYQEQCICLYLSNIEHLSEEWYIALQGARMGFAELKKHWGKSVDFLRVPIFHLGSYFYQTLSSDIPRQSREGPGAFLVHWVTEAVLGGQSFSAESPEPELINVRVSRCEQTTPIMHLTSEETEPQRK